MSETQTEVTRRIKMDEQLAAIYGTGASEVTGDDMEKAAAAELLVKLAEEEGVDLNDFSDEEIGEMVNELYGAEGDEGGDEAQEKLAEADFLGRVMAHAYHQEMQEIEKNAAKTPFGERAGGWLKGQIEHLQSAGRHAKEVVKPSRAAKKGYKAALQAKVEEAAKAVRGKAAKESARESAKAGVPSLRRAQLSKMWQGIKGGKGLIGAGAGAAGLAGLAGYGGYKALKKESSALDKVAEERALEMLAESGWIDEEGNLLYQVEGGEEKTALDTAVETRALQILEANGFPVTWNE